MRHRHLRLFSVTCLAAALCGSGRLSAAQTAQTQTAGATVQGAVRDASGKPVAGATVTATLAGTTAVARRTKSSADGFFTLQALTPGRYTLSAVKDGAHSQNVAGIELGENDLRQVDLALAPQDQMSFSDSPDFTVASVTDWTAVGGHGSDNILRTSEDLARETAGLKSQGGTKPVAMNDADVKTESRLRATLAASPGSFAANRQLGRFYLQHGRVAEALPLLEAAYRLDPDNTANERDLTEAYQDAGDWERAGQHVQHLLSRNNSGDLHRIAGDLEEKLGDPLAAVLQYREAVTLEPSEQNYLAWGAELLLHRAVWQAMEVFSKGVRAYPESPRLLTAQGAALFAGAEYDEAATLLCRASDLEPENPQPYLFMSKVDMSAPSPLPCVEQRLARFVRLQPDDAMANYGYAMAVWKRNQVNASSTTIAQVKGLLNRAVTLDAKCAEGYLQLGILAASQRDYRSALSLYGKAVEIDPQLSEAHYRLGVAYDRLGLREQAAREFALHDQLQKEQAAAVDEQRREVKQFVVISGSAAPATQ